MTDARRLSTINSWFSSLTLRQELAALAGVILFLAGLFVGSVVLKILLFAAASSAIAYVVVTFRSKESRDEGEVAEKAEEAEKAASELHAEQPGAQEPDARQEDVETAGVAPMSSHAEAVILPHPEAEHQERKFEFQLTDFFDLGEDVAAQDSGPKSKK